MGKKWALIPDYVSADSDKTCDVCNTPLHEVALELKRYGHHQWCYFCSTDCGNRFLSDLINDAPEEWRLQNLN
jgi:hypothetical protein